MLCWRLQAGFDAIEIRMSMLAAWTWPAPEVAQVMRVAPPPDGLRVGSEPVLELEEDRHRLCVKLSKDRFDGVETFLRGTDGAFDVDATVDDAD